MMEGGVKPVEFQIWIGRLNELSARQRAALESLLVGVGPSPEAAVIELVESQRAEQSQCPHRGGTRLLAWGKANGLRRRRCADCHRTFNALTGTPLARLRHKARWLTHGAALTDGLSVRRAAEACEVAISTAFRWRHRFLKAGKITAPGTLSGIVEADETFFRRSFKGSRQWKTPRPETPAPARKPRKRATRSGKRGTPLDEMVPVLIARDRDRNTGDAILEDMTAATIRASLLPMLGKETLLCGDAAGSYGAIARAAGIRHEAVNLKAGERVRDSVFHIQNVNAYDSRLKQWMGRFNGVATRYLDSYLGWRRLIERAHTTISPQLVVLNAC
jgi:transposase-like protein